jgi:hypothetical protein
MDNSDGSGGKKDVTKPLRYKSSTNIPVEITTGGQRAKWSAGASDKFYYQSPTIVSVTTRLLNGTIHTTTPTSGTTVDGKAIKVRVEGANMGVSGRVRFGVTDISTFIAYGHDAIEFLLPEGQGKNIIVTVFMGEQTASKESAFAYDPPTLHSALPRNGPTDACHEFERKELWDAKRAVNPNIARNCTEKVCVCVCVCERERERESNGLKMAFFTFLL